MKKIYMLLADELSGNEQQYFEKVITVVNCEEENIAGYCKEVNLYNKLISEYGLVNYRYKEVVTDPMGLPAMPSAFTVNYKFGMNGKLKWPYIDKTDEGWQKMEISLDDARGYLSFTVLPEELSKPLGEYTSSELEKELREKVDEKAEEAVKFYLNLTTPKEKEGEKNED